MLSLCSIGSTRLPTLAVSSASPAVNSEWNSPRLGWSPKVVHGCVPLGTAIWCSWLRGSVAPTVDLDEGDLNYVLITALKPDGHSRDTVCVCPRFGGGWVWLRVCTRCVSEGERPHWSERAGARARERESARCEMRDARCDAQRVCQRVPVGRP